MAQSNNDKLEELVDVPATFAEHPINRHPVRAAGTHTIKCPYCLQVIARAAETALNKTLPEEVKASSCRILLTLEENRVGPFTKERIFHSRCKKHAAEQSFFGRSLKYRFYYSSLLKEDDGVVGFLVKTAPERKEECEEPAPEHIHNFFLLLVLLPQEEEKVLRLVIWHKGVPFTFIPDEKYLARVEEYLLHAEGEKEVEETFRKIIHKKEVKK